LIIGVKPFRNKPSLKEILSGKDEVSLGSVDDADEKIDLPSVLASMRNLDAAAVEQMFYENIPVDYLYCLLSYLSAWRSWIHDEISS
jgi:hypothetical protein